MLTPSSISSIKSPVARKDVVFTTEELVKRIQDCASEQFIGQLDLHIADIQPLRVSLYFTVGGLIGCASDLHPVRRWCRHISVQCPQLVINTVNNPSEQIQCWGYDSLAELVRQGKVLLGEMAAVIEGYTTEILFDIIQSGEQYGYRSGLQLSYRPIPKEAIDLGWVVIRADQAWRQALQAWQDWQQAGLADFSPNLAPKILQAEQLRQQTSSHAYRNLTALADGNYTLRDLAVKLTQTPLPLTQSLLPYIRKGLIGLIEVGDLSYSLGSSKAANVIQEQKDRVSSLHSVSSSTPQSLTPSSPQATAPLIAYIDDSRIDSQTMGQILAQAGYRFINIQDSVQALVQLLEHKPDLIFLDLVMPIANGYEICAQIRRVSLFKDTPVIILTGNDGIVDRVRAKMVGSSGFLSKPITQQKVLSVLQRYLPAAKPLHASS
ncbi:MAG TPA: response regulator [Cyanobacteria bacterium UBA8803]|nr:response regulator [Cyanobacteria bacterium UBA9273]HBL60739.1 response regulator [Cyanobacteria bacterium UBA8803]